MSSHGMHCDSFAHRVGGQNEPYSPGERESQLLRASRAGGAAPPKIKDIVPWYTGEKSISSDLVQWNVQITKPTYSQKAAPRRSWKVMEVKSPHQEQ